MGDVYASALGTTVLRHRSIPPRPSAYDGELILLSSVGGYDESESDDESEDVEATAETAAKAKTKAKVDKAQHEVRRLLEEHSPKGSIQSVTWQGEEFGKGKWRVHVRSHAEALMVMSEVMQSDNELVGQEEGWEEYVHMPLGTGAACFPVFNERKYDDRGWCTFESAVTTEVLARVAFYPEAKLALDDLPPKLFEIDNDTPIARPEVDAGLLHQGTASRVEQVRSDIQASAFTGKGDKPMVIQLYNEYEKRIARAIPAALKASKASYEGARNGAGQREGRGKLRYHDGDEYDGEWAADEMDGQGVYRHANGAVYEGQWRAGQMEGLGKMIDENGNTYIGEFKNGLRDGLGTYRFSTAADRAKDLSHVQGSRWKAGTAFGDGVQWTCAPPNAGRSGDLWTARRLCDGKVVGSDGRRDYHRGSLAQGRVRKITLSRAKKIAKALGLEVPLDIQASLHQQ